MDEKKKKKEKAREKITHRPISNVILARRSITMLDSIYTRPGKISKNVITRWQTIEKKIKNEFVSDQIRFPLSIPSSDSCIHYYFFFLFFFLKST